MRTHRNAEGRVECPSYQGWVNADLAWWMMAAALALGKIYLESSEGQGED